MRILIVEDEKPLREQILSLMATEKYACDAAADGREGLFLGSEYDYDLAIIDLGLPLMDGTQLIRELRSKERNFPILILTARGNWQDKVGGLEAGADDYLTKPCHPEELHVSTPCYGAPAAMPPRYCATAPSLLIPVPSAYIAMKPKLISPALSTTRSPISLCMQAKTSPKAS
jgi:CheY-like chemotaxis protein